MSGAPTLRIDIRPSRGLAALLALVHIVALAAAWSSLSGWPRYVVGFGVLLSAAACLAEVLQRSSRAATSVELHADGRALWRDRAGVWHGGTLGGDHYLSPVLVVVGFRPSKGRRKRIVLLADSASSDDLRRLRVWLRWHRQAAPGADAATRSQ